MTKRLVAGLVIVLFIVITGLFVWRLISKQPKTSSTQNTQSILQPPISSDTSASSIEPGKYVSYNPADVTSDKNTKLLFFHASWCPQCRALDVDISKNISGETGVSVYKVDYDTNQGLRQKYGVTLQTTVVRIDDSGNLVKKYVAYNEPSFANVKTNLLQ